MKIATWNVNSLRVRLQHVLDWLAVEQPDILALQEIKQLDEDFPHEAFQAAGYHAVCAGQKTYNGVALLSREPCQEVIKQLPQADEMQKRFIAATLNGWRIINVYVPNGESVDSEKYQYKLRWLSALQSYLKLEQASYPKLVLVGDFNVAPEDRDVYDPIALKEQILCSTPEREALHHLLDIGLTDVFRAFAQPPKKYSWWDYRAGAFQRNQGLRIDLILANAGLAQEAYKCWIDITPRAWERPSDHVPVIAQWND